MRPRPRKGVGVDKLEWVVANWQAIGAVLSLALALLSGKKTLNLWQALRVVMQSNECADGDLARRRVGAQVEDGEVGLGAASELRNMGARVDPDPKKRPSLKESMKSLAPDLARQAGGMLLNRIFNRRRGGRA